MGRGKPRRHLMGQGRVVRMQFRTEEKRKMLNPAYSLDEQAEVRPACDKPYACQWQWKCYGVEG